MGQNLSGKLNPYEMNVEIIGTNMENFKKNISTPRTKVGIQKHWNFNYINKNVNEQINEYFNKLEKNILNISEPKECLLIKIEGICSSEINLVLKRMDDLYEVHWMPLVLFLLNSGYSSDMKFYLDKNKYQNIDNRLINFTRYKENDEDQNILKILLRFCSIHNELGDRFKFTDGDGNEDIDLCSKYFPFNINIACVGRFGQGKSTGVNVILNDYRAKESSKGSSQTKELTYYQHDEQAIRVLDIPGFEDDQTVNKAIEKLKLCNEKLNKLKDKLHLILYFLNYNEDRIFANLEKSVLEEICKHTSSKLIYVITHSDPNMKPIQKKIKIRNINLSLQGIFKNNSYNKLNATEENTVFVNFHVDKKTKFEKFGINTLFKKMYDFFIQSGDYKEANESKNSETYIKEKLRMLRAQAEDVVFYNKIGGALVGIIPGLDWVLQKFVIKKNAAIKVGQIYGIDVKFSEKEGIKNIAIKPDYITASMEYFTQANNESKKIIFDKDGNKILDESTSFIVGNGFKVTGEAASYITGGISVGKGIIKAASIASGANSAATIAVEGAEVTAAAASTAGGIGATVLKGVGVGCFVLGAVLGVALGGYFTNEYCNELIDKFENDYKNNIKIIGESYKQAAQYLLDKSKI